LRNIYQFFVDDFCITFLVLNLYFASGQYEIHVMENELLLKNCPTCFKVLCHVAGCIVSWRCCALSVMKM